MNNREIILHSLKKIHTRYQRLKEIVDNTSHESLDDILDVHFYEFTTNIETNFTFMEMLITRETPKVAIYAENESDMTNDELINFFKNHFSLLYNDIL